MLTLYPGGVNLDGSSDPSSGSFGASPRRPTFAELLNHLFDTRRTSRGRPYTLTEVSEGTGLSVPYLSNIRKGTITSASFERVEKIAKFFGVPLDYFSSQELPPVEAPSLPTPTADRPILLRSGPLGSAENAVILQALERAEAELREIRAHLAARNGENGERLVDTAEDGEQPAESGSC